ncbi:MAG TPA: hypothetical protein PLQ36_03135, partial [Candidatus Gracilibacteria bacterium]|nr:hypothetical protein [Candidatus Gracilibacteria bacterium]
KPELSAAKIQEIINNRFLDFPDFFNDIVLVASAAEIEKLPHNLGGKNLDFIKKLFRIWSGSPLAKNAVELFYIEGDYDNALLVAHGKDFPGQVVVASPHPSTIKDWQQYLLGDKEYRDQKFKKNMKESEKCPWEFGEVERQMYHFNLHSPLKEPVEEFDPKKAFQTGADRRAEVAQIQAYENSLVKRQEFNAMELFEKAARRREEEEFRKTGVKPNLQPLAKEKQKPNNYFSQKDSEIFNFISLELEKLLRSETFKLDEQRLIGNILEKIATLREIDENLADRKREKKLEEGFMSLKRLGNEFLQIRTIKDNTIKHHVNRLLAQGKTYEDFLHEKIQNPQKGFVELSKKEEKLEELPFLAEVSIKDLRSKFFEKYNFLLKPSERETNKMRTETCFSEILQLKSGLEHNREKFKNKLQSILSTLTDLKAAKNEIVNLKSPLEELLKNLPLRKDTVIIDSVVMQKGNSANIIDISKPSFFDTRRNFSNEKLEPPLQNSKNLSNKKQGLPRTINK